MVAGSRSGNARGFGRGLTLLPATRAATRAVHLTWPRAGALPAALALYLLAAAALLLPWPFAAHPAWAYNWEGYSAWRWATFWERPAGPSWQILAPTDGLMTDSGQGPLTGLLMAIGIGLAGFNVGAMRIPVSLLAALSVPLLWLLGRRVVGAGAATFAAILLATSPAFLVYARTATLVGVSLAPLLLATLALSRVLDAPSADGWRWRREGVLAGSLLLGIFAYAPVRLLWPLAILMLMLAAWRQRARRGVLVRALLLCALAVPLAVMMLEQATAPEPEPLAAAVGYFHARGEQLVAMGENPGEAGHYLRDPALAGAAGWEPAARLVAQNAADLGRLLLDRDTAPVLTDYWNERGRLWPWFLLPFAAIGALRALSRGWRGRKVTVLPLLPLLLFLGLALPLLLTSRVHIGRLLPALPFALLLAASGVWVCAGWLAALARRAGARGAQSARWVMPLLAGAILLPLTVLARGELSVPLTPSREARAAAALAAWQEAAAERGGAVLVEDPALGDDIERVHAATYRLDLDRDYRFVDIQAGDEAAGDGRPALYWRGALGALQAGAIADPCHRLWFVAPEIGDQFLAAWRAAGCRGAPDSVILP